MDDTLATVCAGLERWLQVNRLPVPRWADTGRFHVTGSRRYRYLSAYLRVRELRSTKLHKRIRSGTPIIVSHEWFSPGSKVIRFTFAGVLAGRWKNSWTRRGEYRSTLRSQILLSFMLILRRLSHGFANHFFQIFDSSTQTGQPTA
jgi:hypothetical protein